MVLLLVVHTVENVTAKVPFATILLQDLVAQKKTGEHKCRQLVPTSGARSSSLWDTDDAAALLAWLQESCGAECAHEAFEVQVRVQLRPWSASRSGKHPGNQPTTNHSLLATDQN
jgi:hypothetical protein